MEIFKMLMNYLNTKSEESLVRQRRYYTQCGYYDMATRIYEYLYKADIPYLDSVQYVTDLCSIECFDFYQFTFSLNVKRALNPDEIKNLSRRITYALAISYGMEIKEFKSRFRVRVVGANLIVECKQVGARG